MDDQGLYAALIQRGMTRRSFLKFSSAMAAALALPASYAPRIARAVEAAPRLPVVWVRAQTCGGNTESLLRSPDPKIETMLLDTISLEYHQSLLAAAGPGLDLARTTAMERYPDGYVAVVEGAIPDGAGGAYCLVGGRPVQDIVREVAAGAKAVIAVGSCACDGGAPAANGGLTDAKGIRGLVGDTKLITLPGCPMNVINLTAVIVHYLTFREWPSLDMMGRPLAAYGNLIHNQCERRPHFEFGEFVLSWGDEGAQRGWCLYKMGCKGPEAMGNCPTVRYGFGVSWNIRAGAGCIGCVTTDSWDQMGPAYRRLPSPVPFFPNLTTDTVGAAIVGGVAVVAGVHAVGMSTRYKRRARNARREALATAAAAEGAEAVADPLTIASEPGSQRPTKPRRPTRSRPTLTPARPPPARPPPANPTLAAHPMPPRRPGPRSPDVARITIDPVSRIGGQLRIDADVSGGRVTSAWSSATMFRGMETVLPGRDPRDVWLLAQRICGTCNGVHAVASVRAVEQALGIRIPTNARLIRNVLAGTLFVRDHVMALYQGSLPDWVDMSAILTADPVATSRLATASSAWPDSGPTHFRDVRDRLAAAITSPQAGPFAPAWPDHPAYRLSPEQSLLLVAHMLAAFDWQADFGRIQTLLSGKEAHPQTYLVGGMSLAPPWGGPTASRTRQHPQVPDRSAPVALSDEGIDLMRGLVADARTFVDQVFVPDISMLLSAYPEWVAIGSGPGNYLANGEFPLDDGAESAQLLPGGRLLDGNLQRAEPVSESGVGETVVHAWYTYSNGDEALKRPFEGETVPEWTGEIPLAQLSDGAKYTWIKAARYDGRVMETGALARVLVAAANGQSEVRSGLGRLLAPADIAPTVMTGALGRMVARAVEAEVIARKLDAWLWELKSNLATGDVTVANIELWDPASWPDETEGWSLGEGPRGSVGHWLRIKNAIVDHYQVVDGSTWNASPRDALGLPGPIEAALVGLEVADPAQPVELLRVIHSFAPCAACAAHVFETPATGWRPAGAPHPEGTR